ncbi:MAG: RelA/SpoT family protein [bacterium]
MSSATSEPVTKKAYQKLRCLLQNYLDKPDLKQIKQAFVVAANAHDGQKRRSGEPYITHPIAVATILAEMHMDTDSISAALLHDTVEDTEIELDDLRNEFGPVIANMVHALTKMERLPLHSKEEVSAASFRKLLFATSDDLRAIVVKLADRVHNISTIDAMKKESQVRIARETLGVYAPVAEQLGIYKIRDILQSKAFAALDPGRKKEIEKDLQKKRNKYESVLESTVSHIEDKLKQEGIEARIQARIKSTYSIYRKMQSKRQNFDEIMDIFGIRIIVDEPVNCYISLGIVHAAYPARQGRFKDYISVPKETTGYQSLHTVINMHTDVPVEIQIRTEEMDFIAEYGIAAHSRYKGGGNTGYSHHLQQMVERMQGNHENDDAPLEFLENVKEELIPREVMVFTPKGKLIELPEASTVLDFAYHVHTEVGNHCVTAYVDGRSVGRGEKLESGQNVRIVTSERAYPTLKWQEQVASARAKTAIRQSLRKMESEEAVVIGMRMLDAASADLHQSLESLNESLLEQRLDKLGFQKLEDLAVEICKGNVLPHSAAEALLGKKIAPNDRGNILSLDGTETTLVNYANCCHPIPGDKILGYLTKGKGTVIHRADCPNLEELQKVPDRIIKCRWVSRIKGGFLVPVEVTVEDAPGVLSSLTSITGKYEINIEDFNYIDRDVITTIRFALRVKNAEVLEQVMDEIYNLDIVKKIKRA